MGLTKGDIVLYNYDKQGFIPAIVTNVRKEEGEDEPILSVVAFITGYHIPAYGVLSTKHGHQSGQWIYLTEPEETKEQPAGAKSKKTR